MRKVIQRECLLCLRKQSDLINPLFFFIAVVCLLPLATVPNLKILPFLGAGVIWVAALLAIMLSLPRLFQDDYLDGTLDLFLLSEAPLSLLILAKLIAQWLLVILPLILISPILALMYHLSGHASLYLMFSLLLGTPILLLLGAIGGALTVGLRNSGLLLMILILPLYVPTLIFGAAIPFLAQQHQPIAGIAAILAAILSLCFVLAPVVAASAIRIGANYQR